MEKKQRVIDLSARMFWAAYIPLELSELAEELQRKRGWKKTELIEKAIIALLEKEEELQSAGLLPGIPELPEGFEYVKTKSGRLAIRPVEDVSL